jgi:holliday junction DNA helicase RuvA
LIASVRGHLQARSADTVVVDVGGIGLRVLVPTSTLARLGGVGEAVSLQTYLYVREDILALYGFSTAEEREMFELLLTVSGVGPRLALALLSGASVDSLRLAIGTGNAEGLTGIPGIGRKLAARIVLELKGKVDVRGAESAPSLGLANGDAEVLAALAGLGYPAVDAQRAVQALPKDTDLSVEEKIVLALRQFTR